MAKKQMSFEESVGRIEEIVRLLEDGSASLDDSLKLYEEGVTLIRECNRRLDTAEKKLRQVVDTESQGAEEEN